MTKYTSPPMVATIVALEVSDDGHQWTPLEVPRRLFRIVLDAPWGPRIIPIYSVRTEAT